MKNMIIRTISGIVFILIIISALFISPYLYMVIFLFFILVMMSEYFRITLTRLYGREKIAAYCAATTLFLSVWSYFQFQSSLLFLSIPLLFTIFIYISTLFRDYPEEKYNRMPTLINSLIYIALPFTLTNLIVFNQTQFDGSILMAMFILLWANDVGAYIFGMLFGQKNGHKLFPSISPKKSWEGFWGGVITSVTISILLSHFNLIPLNIIYSTILSLIFVIFGTLGDLVESQIKRNFGCKDSGSMMPGHGGLLDRFDGALLAFPVATLYLLLISV